MYTEIVYILRSSARSSSFGRLSRSVPSARSSILGLCSVTFLPGSLLLSSTTFERPSFLLFSSSILCTIRTVSGLSFMFSKIFSRSSPGLMSGKSSEMDTDTE